MRDLPQKSPRAGLSKTELSNLLSDFKQDIINDVATQLDTMQAWRKKEDAYIMLVEYCPTTEKRNVTADTSLLPTWSHSMYLLNSR